MARRGRSRFGGSRLFALAATAAAPFLLLAIAGRGLPPVSSADPLPLLRLKIHQGLAPGTKPDPRASADARAAAAEAPLSFEPFFIEARAAEARNDLVRATALMEEARRRRSNFVPTRLQLAAYYLADNRPADMFAELEIALRLNAEIRQAVLPQMVKLVADPGARGALATALARNPGWRKEFFDAAAGQEVNPAHALALWNGVREQSPRGGAALERQLYIQSLLKSGQAPRARALWLSTLPEEARRRYNYLFDGEFSGRQAPPPFGWVLHQEDMGRAEYSTANGGPMLELNYFGGRNVLLAEQTLALPAGRYRLRYAGRSDGGIDAANFRWSFVCEGSGQEFARLPITDLAGGWQSREAEFTVPGTCTGQKIRLQAEPGDISSPVTFGLRALEIAR